MATITPDPEQTGQWDILPKSRSSEGGKDVFSQAQSFDREAAAKERLINLFGCAETAA